MVWRQNYTDWLFIPIKCYEINSKTNTLKETKESKDFCIEHVYLPYQRKQGSVKLGIRTKLNGEKYLYTTTTFWIADKIGAEKFSDVEGDFTTDVMKIYNSFDVAYQSVKNDKMMSAYMNEFVSFNVLDKDYVEAKEKELENQSENLQLEEIQLQEVNP